MEKANILGINLSNLSKQEVINKIKAFLRDSGQHYIVTPNPEIVLRAQKDEEYFYIINNADIQLPDGFGLKLAGFFLGKNIPRITGVDLASDLLKFCEKNRIKIGVANKKGGLTKNENIQKFLQTEFPKLSYVVEEFALDDFEYSRFDDFQPQILFCALGAPGQEKFICHGLKKMPYVKVGLGIGGAFDFLTGKIRRAPKPFRLLGLEWLWRLLNLPFYTKRKNRAKRIMNAVIVFPIKFFKWRFVCPFLYRDNVACLLYKKSAQGYSILIVERKNESGHWQIPQGGTGGMPVEKAGASELMEELNLAEKDIRPVKVFKNIYKYKFHYKNDVSRRRAGAIRRHTGYKGQKQSLLIAEFLGRDNEIKINFWDHQDWRWISADKLIGAVHPSRKEAAKLFLNKFHEIKA